MKKSIATISLIILYLIAHSSSINACYLALGNMKVINRSELIAEGEFLTSNKSESFVLFKIDSTIMGTSPSETIAVHIWQDYMGAKFVVKNGDKCFLCMYGQERIDSQITESFDETEYSKYPLFATISFSRYRLDDRYYTPKIKAIKWLAKAFSILDLKKRRFFLENGLKSNNEIIQKDAKSALDILITEEVDIEAIEQSIQILKDEIDSVWIEMAVVNSDNNLVLIGKTAEWINNDKDIVYREMLQTHYIGLISLTGKIITPWKKFFETTKFISIGMPLDIATDKKGNTYLFWRYRQWDGPRGGFLRFTMFDGRGDVKIDTFKVDNEEKYDTLNIGHLGLKIKEDEKGNLHLFAPRQYVMIDTQKDYPQVMERFHFDAGKIKPPNPQWVPFSVISSKSFDFFPLGNSKFLMIHYLGTYKKFLKLFDENKEKFKDKLGEDLWPRDMPSPDAYKKDYFTTTILNFNNFKYEHYQIINIPMYSIRKYIGDELPNHRRLQSNVLRGLVELRKLGDMYVLNLVKKNEQDSLELFQFLFDKQGTPTIPDKKDKNLEPENFENLRPKSKRYAKITEYLTKDRKYRRDLILYGFDNTAKYYQSVIRLHEWNP